MGMCASYWEIFLFMNIFLMVAMERNKRSLLQNYIQMGRYIFFIFQW